MKKAALCVALAVMATGAMAKNGEPYYRGGRQATRRSNGRLSGQVVGFDVDLTKALCARMNV